jgi:hypothetical protein
MLKRKRAKHMRDTQSYPKPQPQKGSARELSDADIETIAGGPNGHPWMRQTPGMNEQS